MSLIKCKVKLKFRWTNYYVLASTGTENADANSNNIIFTIKNTKLYVTVITLSTKDNEKLSKLRVKGFQRSVYGMNMKQKVK